MRLNILLGCPTLTSFHTALFETEMGTGVSSKRLEKTTVHSLSASFIQGIPKCLRHLKQSLVLIVNARDAGRELF